MNRLFSVCLILTVFLLPLRAEKDILLTIDGDDISLSEFLYSYNRVRKFRECTPMEYFQDFLKCKLMVADAKRRELDDNEEFYRRLSLVEHILSTKSDALCCMSSKVKIEMFTYRLPQKSSDVFIHNANVVMGDVYNRLCSGVSSFDIISNNKDLNLSFEDFNGEWVDRTFILDEINNEIDRLVVGSISKIVYSPEGIHLIILKDKCKGPESLTLGNGDDNVLMVKLVKEALLLTEWERKADLPYCYYSDDDLQRYFKRNRKKYRWEFPHYKGAVIHCSSKRSISRLKKRLKKQPLEKWEEIITSFCKDNGEKLEFDIGLFMIGSNKYIDRLVFKCGDFDNVENYPYTSVIGKCLDYEPEDFRDVYTEVLKDCLKEGEDRFFDDLEKKFKVEKHLDVLKTVNCSVSN